MRTPEYYYKALSLHNEMISFISHCRYYTEFCDPPYRPTPILVVMFTVGIGYDDDSTMITQIRWAQDYVDHRKLQNKLTNELKMKMN